MSRHLLILANQEKANKSQKFLLATGSFQLSGKAEASKQISNTGTPTTDTGCSNMVHGTSIWTEKVRFVLRFV